MQARNVVDRYFTCIRGHDIDGLIALYAKDATFVLPSGRELSGLAAIREMHLGVFAASAPNPSPMATVIGEHSAAVEIEARLSDGSVRRTANFYHLNSDGHIQRLSVYMRAAP